MWFTCVCLWFPVVRIWFSYDSLRLLYCIMWFSCDFLKCLIVCLYCIMGLSYGFLFLCGLSIVSCGTPVFLWFHAAVIVASCCSFVFYHGFLLRACSCSCNSLCSLYCVLWSSYGCPVVSCGCSMMWSLWCPIVLFYGILRATCDLRVMSYVCVPVVSCCYPNILWCDIPMCLYGILWLSCDVHMIPVAVPWYPVVSLRLSYGFRCCVFGIMWLACGFLVLSCWLTRVLCRSPAIIMRLPADCIL